MRIAKYVHSCVTLEEDGRRLLFDPGSFSFIDRRASPDDFNDVSVIVLTHAHPDHVDVAALKRIREISGSPIVANSATAAWLEKEGIAVTILDRGELTVASFHLRAFAAPHEAILSNDLPDNTAFVVNGAVLNPGDSFSSALFPYAGVTTLMLPVLAPWLTEVNAFHFAQAMRPQLVIPVHDGYARDFFLPQRYDAYEPHLTRAGIRLARLMEPGASVEV